MGSADIENEDLEVVEEENEKEDPGDVESEDLEIGEEQDEKWNLPT